MKALRILGYVCWFLCCFLLAVVFTFPLGGLRPLIIAEAEKALGKGKQGPHGVDPEVTIGDLSMSGLGVKATRVSIQLANREPEPGPTIDIDAVRVSPSLFSLFGDEKAATISADLYGGEISAEITLDAKQNVAAADISVDDVDLAKIPLLIAKLGVPIEGKVTADIELDMGKQAEKDAAGHVSVDIKGLGLGAGNLTAVPGGFEIPEGIRLGNLKGRIPIKQGQGTIEALRLEGASDVEAEVTGTINVKPRLQASRLDIDGWFRPQAAFLDKNPKIKSALELGEKLSLPGAPSLGKAKDEEGRYHFSAKGSLQTVVPQLAKDAGKRAKQRAGKTETPPSPVEKADEAPASPENPQ